MERYLKKGQSICLNNNEYKVKNIIGKGSSCIVYHTIASDNTEHLLKEYNPCDIELYRDSNGFLEVDNEEEQDEYSVGLKRFENGGKLQRKLRLSNELKNSTCNVQGVYNDYGTAYIDMTCFSGMTYEKRNNESLYTILKRAKALTEVVGNYHNAGFLHLDIKPENIFTLEETEEFVMLFDFDSIIEKSNLSDKPTLSYTKSWAAPEQLLIGRQGKICEATDIFAIGEIIFYKLFGRHSTTEEKRSFSEYVYDFESIGLKNVNPKVKPLLDDLFHHTICTNVNKRYKSAEELAVVLDKLIEIACPKTQYIKTSLPKPEDNFFGRNREVAEIGDIIDQKNILFISGVGGIGKSELAKQFAKNYIANGRYDTVIFMPFVADIMSMIIDDEKVSVYNFYKYPAEEIQNYYNRKMRKLKELCDEKTLIIIDNFDVEDLNSIDDEFKKITELNCDVLITTRFDFTELGYAQYYLDKIDDECDILNIFFEYYKTSIGDEELKIVKEIISIVDGHTLAVELLAKQMQAGRVKPDAMLKKIKEGGIEQSGKECIISDKDGDISRRNTYSHIRALFDISDLNESEEYILANLSLVPHTGIPAELLYDWCELESYEEINSLTIEGWIRLDRENGYISLHPLVSDIVLSTCLKTTSLEILDTMLKNQYDYLKKYTNEGQYSDTKNISNDILLFSGVARNIYKSKKYSSMLMDVLSRITDFLIDFDYLNEGELYYQYIYINYLNCFGQDHTKLASSLYDLGFMYYIIGKFDLSEQCHKKSFEISQNLYGDNHIDVAKSLNALAVLYSDLGKFDLAKCNYEKSLEIYRKFYEETHPDVIKVLNNIGVLHSEKNEFDLAEQYHKKVLELWKSKYGYRHINVANSLNNMGGFYCDLKQYFLAEKYYKESLELRIDIYGEENLHVSKSLQNLGLIYSEILEFDLAKEYYEKALKIYRKVYGEEHPDVANVLDSLGQLYCSIGKFDVSEYYHKEALELFRKIYGDKHNFVARTINNLGVLYFEQEKYELAKQCYEQAFCIWSEIYGFTHTKVAIVLENLGELHFKCGEFKLAKQFYEDTIKIYLNIYDEEHCILNEIKEKLENLNNLIKN